MEKFESHMFKSVTSSSSNQLVYLYTQILILSVVCFLILLGHGKLPDQVDVLFPKGEENSWLYSDSDANPGGSSASWVNKTENAFMCDVVHTIDWPY